MSTLTALLILGGLILVSNIPALVMMKRLRDDEMWPTIIYQDDPHVIDSIPDMVNPHSPRYRPTDRENDHELS